MNIMQEPYVVPWEHAIVAFYPEWGGVHSPGRHPSGKDPSSPQKDEKGVTEREERLVVPGRALGEGAFRALKGGWCGWTTPAKGGLLKMRPGASQGQSTQLCRPPESRCLILRKRRWHLSRGQNENRSSVGRPWEGAEIKCPCAVLSHSDVSYSLWPHGLQSTRLFFSWGFSRQEHWSGLPCPPPGNLPNPGIRPRSSSLQVDSLPTEPPGKPKNTGVGSLSLLQGTFLTQESNWGLLHCWWILYQLSYKGSP